VVPVAAPPEMTLRQLAHELNSLLDGSMRCVGLARDSLTQSPRKPQVNDASGPADDLGRAQAAMAHMAALLRRAMQPQSEGPAISPVTLFDAEQSLGSLTD